MPQLTIQQAFDLALQHYQAGQRVEAEQLFRQILQQEPAHAEALHLLGVIANESGNPRLAVDLIRQSVAINPLNPEALNNLAGALSDTGEQDAAIAMCYRALEIAPNFVEAYNNLGIAFSEKEEFDMAIAAYRQAIAIRPDYADPHANLGNPLKETGRLEEAIVEMERALALNDNLPKAHANLGVALLTRGDFARGWREYEWRWKAKGFETFPHPYWDGGDLNGRTILLHAEQGLGDAIQFVRYLPVVVQRGGRIVVAVHSPMLRLLRQLPGAAQWVASIDPMPEIDVQCPFMSLPRIFGTTLATIPPPQLLTVEPEIAKRWYERMKQQPAGLKVGLVWAGNPNHISDRHRSMALSQLAPLGAVSGVQFYSLQKGEPARQAEHPPAGMRLVDWTADLNDFADTAGLLAHLDLVITVDTAIAHLAGAMGKPVWLLLHRIADWRWLLDREDSPWYPTMRLFRQSTRGDWPGVVDRVATALAELGCKSN